MTRPGKIPAQAGFEPGIFCSWGQLGQLGGDYLEGLGHKRRGRPKPILNRTLLCEGRADIISDLTTAEQAAANSVFVGWLFNVQATC